MQLDVTPLDPVTALREAFVNRRRTHARYTLQTFAQELEMSPSDLQAIMQRRETMNCRQATHLAMRLEMADQEAQDFIAAAYVQTLPRPITVQASPKRKGKRALSFRLPEIDSLEAISRWESTAILDLATTPDFQPSPEWIATRLNISPQAASDGITRLIRLGLLVRRGRKVVRPIPPVVFISHAPKVYVREHLAQMMDKAQLELRTRTDVDAIRNRQMTAHTIAVNPERIASAKAMIEAFQEKLAKHLTQGPCTEVFQLNIQLFALTQPMRLASPQTVGKSVPSAPRSTRPSLARGLVKTLAALALLSNAFASASARAATADTQRSTLLTYRTSPSARHAAAELPSPVEVGEGWSESSVSTPLCYRGQVTDTPTPRSVRYRVEFKNSRDSMTVRATATVVDYRTAIADVKLIDALRQLPTLQVWNFCGEQYVATTEYGARLTEEFVFPHPIDDENFTGSELKSTFRDLELLTVPGAHAVRDVEFEKAFSHAALVLKDYTIATSDVHVIGALPPDRIYGSYFEDQLEMVVFKHYAETVPKLSRRETPLVSFVTAPMPLSVVQWRIR